MMTDGGGQAPPGGQASEAQASDDLASDDQASEAQASEAQASEAQVSETEDDDLMLDEEPADHRVVLPLEIVRPEVDAALGRSLYRKSCAICHGANGNGFGPVARNLWPKPADLTLGVYKIRSTENGQPPTDGDIFRTLTRGLPGTAMQGWLGLSADDRWQLVYFLKSLAPSLKDAAAKPVFIPEPSPPTYESIEQGRALFGALGCTSCHGYEGLGDGPQALDLKDDRDFPIYPPNFSRSLKFKGGSSARDIYRTLHTGLNGTPMKSFGGMLTSSDTWALAHYIRSLRMDQPTPAVATARDAARRSDAVSGALQKLEADAQELRQQLAEEKAQRAADAEAQELRLQEQLATLRESLEAKLAAEGATPSVPNAEEVAAAQQKKAAADAKRQQAAAAKRAEKKAAAETAAFAKRRQARLAAAARRRAAAKKIYQSRCAVCHGMKGQGDGPAAGGLRPAPRDFTSRAWQGKVSNKQIEKAIVEGGVAVGVSAAMPPAPDLASKPGMVRELRRLVRAFGDKKAKH